MAANLDTLARTALAAFRDAFAGQLAAATASPFPRPLDPHVVGYKAGIHTPFGSRLIKGAHVTGKFTTADFVWSGRARFWITVGLTDAGQPAIQVSLTGFGSNEAFWPDELAPGGDVAAAAAHLGQAVAIHVVRDRYAPGYGW